MDSVAYSYGYYIGGEGRTTIAPNMAIVVYAEVHRNEPWKEGFSFSPLEHNHAQLQAYYKFIVL